MVAPITIAAAGNTEVPAYLVLAEKGFEVVQDGQHWTASRGELTLVGSSPLELLALLSIHDARGAEWKATDEEINDFVARYPQQ